MKIDSIKKKNDREYIIKGDNESLLLYGDTIIKYNMLTKKEINDKDIEGIKQYNNSLVTYFKILRKLQHKRMTESEVKKQIAKESISQELENDFINKYKDMRLIDDVAYLEAYIHDAINLKKIGPRKIETDLLKLGFNLSLIREKLELVEENTWLEIIDKYIEKKIKANRTDSPLMLKVKTASFIVHQGFTKEMTMQEISKYDFNDSKVVDNIYNKLKRQLEKKYTGDELQQMIKKKMQTKGFEIEDIDKYL